MRTREVRDRFDQPFVTGRVTSGAGPVPRVATRLTAADHWGTVKVRWGVGRMSYTVDPGLYAVGAPGADSPVLVSANYKLSFDTLRRAAGGLDAWILVLDTHGVNVWCAAGKGTFGTDELVKRIQSTNLAAVVAHRKLVVPQLGAPGVAAWKVTKATRFKVVWGPVDAGDLQQFVADGLKAGPEMRHKRFPLWERAVLIPVELVESRKLLVYLAPALVLLAALGGLGGTAGYWSEALGQLGAGALAVLGGLLAGAVLMPLLLPWLPGRAFSLKGVWPGVAVAALLAWASGGLVSRAAGLEAAGWGLVVVALAAFMAMNFTGASTYTSLSGVKREMRTAVPLQLAGVVLGVGLWIAGRLMA